MAREPPGVEQVDVLRDGAQSVLGEQMRADGESTAPIHALGAPCAIACASVPE